VVCEQLADRPAFDPVLADQLGRGELAARGGHPDAGGRLRREHPGCPQQLVEVPSRAAVAFDRPHRSRQLQAVVSGDVTDHAALADNAKHGIQIRVALGDPDCDAVAERGREEGIGDAISAKIRNALTLYHPLTVSANVEIRLHETVLYNSIDRADDQFLVNQDAYGVPAARAPALSFRSAESRDIATGYPDSFERVWTASDHPIQDRRFQANPPEALVSARRKGIRPTEPAQSVNQPARVCVPYRSV
jgi:hypothetical protein